MRQQGERLKRHLRETDTLTWCGRRRDTVVSRGANGVERWLNGKRRERPATRTCMTPGCGTAMAAWKWLCDGCFRQLPFARKKAICEARQARNPAQVFGLSRDAAGWLQSQREKRVEG